MRLKCDVEFLKPVAFILLMFWKYFGPTINVELADMICLTWNKSRIYHPMNLCTVIDVVGTKHLQVTVDLLHRKKEYPLHVIMNAKIRRIACEITYLHTAFNVFYSLCFIDDLFIHFDEVREAVGWVVKLYHLMHCAQPTSPNSSVPGNDVIYQNPIQHYGLLKLIYYP